MKMRYALMLTLSLAATSAGADDAATLWKAKCKSCHGEDGKGQTKMGKKESIDDLSDAGWQKRHSNEKIRKVIAEGSPRNKKMKAFKDKLTAEQIDSLVAYIRTLEAK